MTFILLKIEDGGKNMSVIERKIYDDISMEILGYLSKRGIEYDLEKEKKEIAKRIDERPQKDKGEVEANERFSMRTISLCNWLQKVVPIIPRKVYFSKYLSKQMDGNINNDIIDLINIFKKKI